MKRNRVRKRREFQEIQANARRVVSTHFVLLLRARPSSAAVEASAGAAAATTEMARLGVTASRRIGNAVVRNRAKRLIREAFRATSDLWHPELDVIVIARRPLEELKLAAVIAEWRSVAALLGRRSHEARQDRAKHELQLAKSLQSAQTPAGRWSPRV